MVSSVIVISHVRVVFCHVVVIVGGRFGEGLWYQRGIVCGSYGSRGLSWLDMW